MQQTIIHVGLDVDDTCPRRIANYYLKTVL